MAYRTGEMSAKAAAEFAYGMREALLRLQWQKSTALGRALAVELRAKGLSLDEVLAYRSPKQFGCPFHVNCQAGVCGWVSSARR